MEISQVISVRKVQAIPTEAGGGEGGGSIALPPAAGRFGRDAVSVASLGCYGSKTRAGRVLGPCTPAASCCVTCGKEIRYRTNSGYLSVLTRGPSSSQAQVTPRSVNKNNKNKELNKAAEHQTRAVYIEYQETRCRIS